MAGTPHTVRINRFGTVRFNSSYSLNPMLYSAFIILRLLFLILIIILLRQSNANCSPSTTPRRLFPSSLHASSSTLRFPFMLRFPLLPSFTPPLLPLRPHLIFTAQPKPRLIQRDVRCRFCIVDKANVQKQCRLINYQCRNDCSLSRTQLTIDSCIASYPCMQSWPASNVSRETSRE